MHAYDLEYLVYKQKRNDMVYTYMQLPSYIRSLSNYSVQYK